MKHVFILLLCLLLCSFVPEAAEPLKITLPMIMLLVVGFYEVIVRIVPTVGQWGVLGKIIEILAWLSNFLNRKRR